ncbi:hypothetical protein [Amycolatopsis coloradensis]|uniref:hypothetical protein n=1 Tax=Amycolatopsis coloradensis TaxID=76021 RepID=UPI00130147D4|nr:hypothetical protein [Amycolatopsis coloradensis]
MSDLSGKIRTSEALINWCAHRKQPSATRSRNLAPRIRRVWYFIDIWQPGLHPAAGFSRPAPFGRREFTGAVFVKASEDGIVDGTGIEESRRARSPERDVPARRTWRSWRRPGRSPNATARPRTRAPPPVRFEDASKSAGITIGKVESWRLTHRKNV